MSNLERDAEEREKRIRSMLGEGALALLAGQASGLGLDGARSAVDGAIGTLARGDKTLPTDPAAMLGYVMQSLQHAANQVNTPEGEGPAATCQSR